MLYDGVLREVCIDEFLKTPNLVEEGSPYHKFFKKCVAARNHVATYLENLRLSCQYGDIEDFVVLLFATVPEPNHVTFVRGLFLIFCSFAPEDICIISSLLTSLCTIGRLHSVAQIVTRHMLLNWLVDKSRFKIRIIIKKFYSNNWALYIN